MRKKVKIDVGEAYDYPVCATKGSAGMDLQSSSKENIIIKPGARALIPTGLKFKIPRGYELQIRPRSGLALKHGVTVLNTPGTIDSDYRGRVGVILINHGDKPFKVRLGDRIAQCVLSKLQSVPVWIPDAISDDTERGSGGFGSTGNK